MIRIFLSDHAECKNHVKYPVRERSAQVSLFRQTVGDPVPYEPVLRDCF